MEMIVFLSKGVGVSRNNITTLNYDIALISIFLINSLYMKRSLKIAIAVVLVATAGIATYSFIPSEHTTCTGASPCNACKSCKYCKHCAKDKGTCGVCK